MDWVNSLLAKYGAIVLGLGIGTSAKYGLSLSEGREITFRMFITDLLLIGLVAVLAANAVEQMGLHGNGAVLVAAMFAVSSDRIIRMARAKFLRTYDAEGHARQAEQIHESASAARVEGINAPTARNKFSGEPE